MIFYRKDAREFERRINAAVFPGIQVWCPSLPTACTRIRSLCLAWRVWGVSLDALPCVYALVTRSGWPARAPDRRHCHAAEGGHDSRVQGVLPTGLWRPPLKCTAIYRLIGTRLLALLD
jgi:hypothetical protein